MQPEDSLPCREPQSCQQGCPDGQSRDEQGAQRWKDLSCLRRVLDFSVNSSSEFLSISLIKINFCCEFQGFFSIHIVVIFISESHDEISTVHLVISLLMCIYVVSTYIVLARSGQPSLGWLTHLLDYLGNLLLFSRAATTAPESWALRRTATHLGSLRIGCSVSYL